MANTATHPRNDLAGEANQFATQAKEAVGDAASKAKQTAASLSASAGKKAAEAAAAVGDGMKNLGERIRESLPSEGYLGQASRSVATSLEEGGKYLAKEGLSGLAADLGSAIKRNPLPAVLVGLGLGFLIGRTVRK